MEAKQRFISQSPELARMNRDPLVEDFYPLSPTQSGLLFHSLYAPETGVYFEQQLSTIQGRLDVAAFMRAWRHAGERNAVLRTAFVWEGLAQPVQVVKRRVEIPCRVLDWRRLSKQQHESQLTSFLESDREEGLDLSRAPLMRVVLIRLEEDEWRLVWSHHHLILDGLSLSLLLEEVMGLYERLVLGRPLGDDSRRPYRDYIEWLEKQDRSDAETFWRETLSGFTAPTTLPLPRTDRTTSPPTGLREELVLPLESTSSLAEFASRYRLKLETVVEGAFAIMLRRYCGDHDLLYGTMVSGRSGDLSGIERMVGLFFNALPFRVRVSGSEEILPWLGRIGDLRRSIEPFEHTSLLDVQRWSPLGRESPLFENLLAFENEFVDRSFGEASGDRVRLLDVALNERAKYPLTLVVTAGSRLKLQLLSDGRCFEPTAVRRMAFHFARLLEAIATERHRQLDDLPLLSEAERHQLVCEWNIMDAPAVESCLHQRFEQQVAARPDAVALVDEGEQYTYGCLNARANQLAHHLHFLEIGCEEKVAICLERKAELVVAILGVLKAGGAYVPLDPSYPRERLEFMLEDSGASALLSHHLLRERTPAHHALAFVDLEADREGLSARDHRDPGLAANPDQIAYLIYTSGSTGVPKGVEITHRNVMRLFTTTQESFQFDGDDVWSLFHSFAFDFSVWELFGALLHGGRLVVVPYLTSRSPELFDELLGRERVTVLNQTPSAFRSLLTIRGSKPPSETDLRWVIFGGEALDFALVDPWLREPFGQQPRLVNMYGITETTVHVTHRSLVREDASTSSGSRVGVPISDLEVTLRDRDGNLAPLGVPGEIYVGGAGLARGYRSRPETTAERFVPHPSGPQPGARLYRTGDWARYWPDRDLEFLGRVDQQVKVRGFRIELGEIKAALDRHPAVDQSAVVVRRDSLNEPRIVGYVVSEGSAILARELRAHLQTRLPEHMVPAVLEFVDELPLTPSGKLDIRALPAPSGSRRDEEEDYVAPRNETELSLSRIWQEVLGLDRVGVHDNFFALGGDSILSIQVVARSGARGLKLTPRQIFQFPTISELAPLAGQGAAICAAQGPVTGPVELTPVLRWYLEIEPEPRHFNQVLLLDVSQQLDPLLLRQTLEELLIHHDALRLRLRNNASAFSLDNEGLEAASVQGVFIHVDLLSLSEAARRRAVEEVSARLQASLDPTAAPLIRAAWFDVAASSHRLLLAAHHLAVDGVSWRILLEDMFSVYEQRRRGRPTLLASKTTSFQTWSKRLKEYAGSEELAAEAGYWKDVAGAASGRLPLDRTEGDNVVESADTVTVSLSRNETRALLQAVPAAYRTQINDVLLAALALELTQWCGSDSVLVDLEGHGREELFEDVDVSRTVGWFTTIFPVRLDPGDRKQPGTVLKRVKEELRRVPHAGLGYGLLRYLRDGPGVSRMPTTTPEVVFNYLGQLDAFLAGRVPVKVASEPTGPTRSPESRRTHLLEIIGAVRDGQLQFGWTYSRNRHARTTIEQRASSFLEMLRGLIDHCQKPASGGVTPSDFPLAPFKQAELDELVGSGRDIEDIYPLAPVQEAILFHSIDSPGCGPYCAQSCWAIDGMVEPELMRRAWERLVQRHGVFRTAFLWEGVRRPAQIVYRSARLVWQYRDWRGVSAEEQESRLREFLDSEEGRAFDLARPPLLRVMLVRLAERRWYIVWSHHRLIADAWSVALQWKELLHSYEMLRRHQQIRQAQTRPYRDFVAWLEKRDLLEDETFWRGTLRGLPAPTRLDLERTEDVSMAVSDRYRRDRLSLSENEVTALEQFARRQGLGVDGLVRAAFAILLSRYTYQADVLFGITVNGRSAPIEGIEFMMGMFMNTLALRLQPRPTGSLMSWLKETQEIYAAAVRHEHTPFAKVRQWSELPLKGRPLFECLLDFQSHPIEPAPLPAQAHLSLRNRCSLERTSFPITLFIAPRRDWSIEICYDARRYEGSSMTRMLEHLRCLLGGIAAATGGSLWELSLLTSVERQQLVEAFRSVRPDEQARERLDELLGTSTGHRSDTVEGSLASGREAADFELYVLDSELEPVPVGIPGQIHVAGALERSAPQAVERAAEELLPNPFGREPGGRLLRARALGRLSHSGTITLLERPRSGGPTNTRGVHVDAGETDEARGGAAGLRTGLTSYVAPRTEEERELSRIWAQVLGVGRVGIRDDFFDLGGDSAAAIQIVSRSRRAGLGMAPTQIFENPTIADLGDIVSGPGPLHVGLERGADTRYVPLTPSQHRFFDHEPTGPQRFAATIPLETTEPLQPRHLDAALRELLAHHEALRVRYRPAADGLSQYVAGMDVVARERLLACVDLSRLSPAILPVSERRVAEQLLSSLDASRGALLRGVLLQRGDGACDQFLLIGHAFVLDTVSWRIVLEDLRFLLEQARQGKPARLRSRTTSFGQVAHRLKSYARGDAILSEVDHWLSVTGSDSTESWVASEVSVGEREQSETSITVELTDEETRSLVGAEAETEPELEGVLLTALVQVLADWSGRRSLLWSVERDGREARILDGADRSRTVGPLTSRFPVRIDVTGAEGLAEARELVHQQLSAVPHRGIGYGLLRYLRGDESLSRRLDVSPDLRFRYLGGWRTTLAENLSLTSPTEPRRRQALDIDAALHNGRLRVCWTFDPGLNPRPIIERLADEFSECLRALVRSRHQGSASETHSRPPADRVGEAAGEHRSIGGEIEDIYPLSPMQQGLLFHSLYAPHSSAYFDQHSCTLDGEFDGEVFREAWQRVVDRHSILRTCFAWDGLMEPMQVVRPRGELPWLEHDWRNLPSDLQRERLESLLHADRMHGLDLKRAPLMRMSLIRLSETSWKLVWSHHHLLLDGWSVPLLLGEVMLFYESLLKGYSLDLGEPTPYRNYIDWLRSQDLAAAESFWHKTLGGFTEPTPLKMGEPSPASIGNGEAFGEAETWLNRELTAALERFARRERTTANTVIQGAWVLLLSRYSGREDVVFGATVSGRSVPVAGIESAVGLFINAVPVRARVRGTTRLSAWLKDLQEQQAEARQYEYAPLAEVQAWSDVRQGEPLFESLLAFENYPLDQTVREHAGSLTIRDVRVYDRTNYPLTIVIVPGSELLLRANYDRHRFTDSSMRRLIRRLSRLIENMVTHSEALLEELQIDTEREIGSAPPILPARSGVRDKKRSGSPRGG